MSVRYLTRTPGQPPPWRSSRTSSRRFREDLRPAGVAGEERLAALEYLALTSRVLPWGKPTERPVSVIAKGTTSTGKSHATQTTLRFFPPSAYLDLGSMSRRYLFYTEEEFSHRFVYVPEWASISRRRRARGDAPDPPLRGADHARHRRGRREADGPPDREERPDRAAVTTTEAAVDAEIETRCLSIVTDDSPEQTRRVFRALAALEDELETPVDFDAWHELQEWIASHGETRVVVPFVDALAELMPAGATRLRRDFVTLLCLVRAHAILYQAQREQDHARPCRRDGRGRLRAGRAARRRAHRRGRRGGRRAGDPRDRRGGRANSRRRPWQSMSPRPRSRRSSGSAGPRPTTGSAVRSAGATSSTWREERARHEARRRGGLPGADDFLPDAEEIVRFMSTRPTGRTDGSTMRADDPLSGSPARPVDPPESEPGGAGGLAALPLLPAARRRL